MDWTAIAAPWLRVEAETDAAHAPVLEGLMARAGLQPGQSVLDIGPGGGVSLISAAQAVGVTGHVTGVEIAPPFADRARERVPDNVTVHVGDAAGFPFMGRSYDAAISMLGVMFFADPNKAFAHIRTALKPGAALSFACWGSPEANPWFSVPAEVADEVFGPGPVLDLDAPGPLSLSDPSKITRLLTAAGWSVEIDTQDLHLTPRGDPSEVAAMYMTVGAAAMRMGAAKAKGILTQEQRDAVRAGLEKVFAYMAEGDAVRIPAQVHYVRAIA
ncbi:class I SAM-dependent methyltransferase [Tropicibacter sp. R16_0]|uniref:class I SAM-dependent methyltransferase n=1 Tax=Tropicibacter sp. R16_0 TaxID=2821102 RepID=UPI001ADCB9E5|nr:class I SAM-dependent methyltransferase [Tropicibacter sp. R16_0]MBO9450662.1 class I SAM-dependent methyltransferase [Tropicibacter sp. R16_0]